MVIMAMDCNTITITTITITHIHTHRPKSIQVHRHRHRLHRLARIRRLTVLLITQTKDKRFQVRRATEMQKAATIGVPAISGRAVAAMEVERLAAEAVGSLEELQARPSPKDQELRLAGPGTEALATVEATLLEVVGPATGPLDTDHPHMELVMAPPTGLHTDHPLMALRMDQPTVPHTAQAMAPMDRTVMVAKQRLSIHRLLLRRDPHHHRRHILPHLRLLHQRPNHRSPDLLQPIHLKPSHHQPKRHKQYHPRTIAELVSRRILTSE